MRGDGRAAGTAAALCVQLGVRPRDVEPQFLRAELVRWGAHLDVGPVSGTEAESAKELAAVGFARWRSVRYPSLPHVERWPAAHCLAVGSLP